jgi:hypothetical protein
VAVGSPATLRFISAADPALPLLRWEWVTYVPEGAGGVIDDAITAMVFDDVSGVLYVGNPTCLNVRYPNSTFTRIVGLDGLPYNQITALAIDDRRDSQPRNFSRLWIGTAAGVILFDPQATVAGSVAIAPDGTPSLQQRWRYFNGPRYLVPAASNLTSTPVTPLGLASIRNDTFVVSAGGVAVLQAQQWTLAQKASYFQSANLTLRHDRAGLGIAGDCDLPAFGVLEGCVNNYAESDGIWTGIQLAADAFRSAVETGPAGVNALASARHFFLGEQLLVNVTGITGLPARSAATPVEQVCVRVTIAEAPCLIWTVCLNLLQFASQSQSYCCV